MSTGEINTLPTTFTPSARLLEGRVTLVTGASSGIGEVVAHTLAAHGAPVVLMARSTDNLNRVRTRIEEAGGRAVIAPADLRDTVGVAESVAAATDSVGPIDRLVHCAADARDQAFLCDLPEDVWATTIDVNLTGAFRVCRSVVPGMMERRSGGIVLVSSIAGSRGLPANTAYCASKFGLNGLMQSLAAELGPFGVRVNAVCPGLVDSPASSEPSRYGESFMESLAKHHGPADLTWERYLRRSVRNTILERMLEPREIANHVLFLLSELSAGTTAQSVHVDAGML